MTTHTGELLRVGLVACGKSKLDHAAPARDLYTGPLFRAASAYAERTYDAWFVLSAKHHLVHPDDVLEPYDVSLAGLMHVVRLQWALHVDIALRCGRNTGIDEDYRTRRNAPEDGPFLGRFTMAGGKVELFLHAGSDYAGPLYDRGIEGWATVYRPLRGLGIGEQLAWYQRQAAEQLTLDVETR
jgi:hypothetical protein